MSIRCIPVIRPFSILLLLFLMVISMTINGCGATRKKSVKQPANEAMESANHLAWSAFEKKMYKQAAGIYEKVLEIAYVHNDTAVILNTRFNLAVCLMELERYPVALKLVNQVRAELAIGYEKMPPDFFLLEATIFYRNNRLKDSWDITEKILEINAFHSPTIVAKTYFLRGLISSDRNDVAGISESIRNLDQPEFDMVNPDRVELKGRLAMAEYKWDQAIIDLDQAARLRKEDREYRRMSIALALSATASEKTGRKEAAAGKYLQAGRSAALRDDQSNARKWLIQAALLFDQTGNDVLTTESNALLLGLDDETNSSNLQD